MNRDKAIKWCKDNLNYWPNTPAPEGWSWIMKDVPYRPSEMILINNKEMAISKRCFSGF